MGIARGAARLLLHECSQRPFCGSVLQLGRQHIYFRMEELQNWASLHGVNLVDIDSRSTTKSNIDCLAKRNFIDDVSFFSALGFESVRSLDVSDHEGATHILDLNYPIPKDLFNKYDVIVDGGTAEHIFHIPQVLSNIYDMLRPDGRIIHLSPSSNHVDHGFYMFSPTLFYDYYTANQWRIDDFKIIEYTVRHDVDPWKIYNYKPGCLSRVSFGGFDRGYLIGIYCVASKIRSSTKTKIPQQGRYYHKVQSGAEAISPKTAQVRKLAHMLKSYPNPKLYRTIKWTYNNIIPSCFRLKKMPPIVSKY